MSTGKRFSIHCYYHKLASSLRDLARAFGVEQQKLHFPYNFMSLETLSYVGGKPDYKFYTNNINPSNNISKGVWE